MLREHFFRFQVGDLGIGHLAHIRVRILEQLLAAGDLLPNLAIALVSANHIDQFGMLLGQGTVPVLVVDHGRVGQQPFDFTEPVSNFFEFIQHGDLSFGNAG